MTNTQRAIIRCVESNFMPGSVKTELIGDKRVRVTDRKGDSMILTTDKRGNIIDAATKKVYAFKC